MSLKYTKPALCFIGPMAGRDVDIIPTPGEFLADHFRVAGYPVIAVSTCKNKFARLMDICRTIVFQHSKIDILVLSVYVGQSFVVEDIASALASFWGIPIIMVLHNGLTPAFVSLFPNWCRRVFSRAKLLVAPSAFLPRALRPYGWQVRIIPNPIEISQYTFRHRPKVSPHLIWMRSFYPYYNPQMALHVLTRLARQHSELSLVMAGKDKGLQPEVIQMAEKLGLAQCVSFPGFLSFAEKIRAFDNADIFINTNSVDNAPVSILEAWAMGLPVISTAIGGIADLVKDGETGLLIPDDDDSAMARAVQTLVENPTLAEKLSRQGREQAESFSWECIQPQWEALFREVLNPAMGGGI
jgi:glycosyltransferase involved in cell wall biosynthesis